MRLEHALENINTYPFHMPGHKRNAAFNLPASAIDITEIEGFDNLHAPSGMLLQIERELSALYKSRKSYLSVNGSTCGVLAAVFAVCQPGDTVLIARNCHKSVYNACSLARLHVEYLQPGFDMEYGLYRAVTQEEVDAALKAHPQTKAVVITSPTYEGAVSRVTCPVPLIVDSAHGAHFSMAPWLPERVMGDIVISSLHKTLPALTQTAVVNVYNEKWIVPVKRYMDIFETSSPSYVLMSSVSRMLEILRKQQTDLFSSLYLNLKRLYTMELTHLKLLQTEDLTKVNISTVHSDITGNQLADLLRKKGIEVEMADAVHVIAMATVGDTKYGFDLLMQALKDIDQSIRPGKVSFVQPFLPQKACEVWQVGRTVPVSVDESIGLVCGEYVFAYPPGVPLLAPGEVIDAQRIGFILDAVEQGTNILSESHLLPGEILTKHA